MERLKFKYKLIDNCPNDGVEEGENGYYYRITKIEPPVEEDFKPTYWLGYFLSQREKFEEQCNHYKLCMSQGISVLKIENDAVHMAKSFKKMNAKAIYKGFLSNEMGVLQKTPTGNAESHHTFYIYKGYDELSIFEEKVWRNV